MDAHTGNSASASGPKKDKKAKKNYEDGDGKKKFVSIPCSFCCLFCYRIQRLTHSWATIPSHISMEARESFITIIPFTDVKTL